MTSERGVLKPIERLRLTCLIRQGDRLIGQQIADQLIFSGQILGSSLLPNYLGMNFSEQISQFFDMTSVGKVLNVRAEL
jgi:hypothetical protein